MQGHDQTRGRSSRLEWPWLILVALIVPAPIEAEERSLAANVGHVGDPITLAADSVRVWKAGECQWLHLHGRVAIIQGGVSGVRSEQAVVRVRRVPQQGMTISELEVYAEGNVRPMGNSAPPSGSARLLMRTEKSVELEPYEGERSLISLAKAPSGLSILERAFPSKTGRPVASTATARVSGAGMARSATPEGRSLNPARAPQPQVTPTALVTPKPAKAVPSDALLLPELAETETSQASLASRSKPQRATQAPIASQDPAALPPLIEVVDQVEAPKDSKVVPTQFEPGGFSEDFGGNAAPSDLPPAIEAPTTESNTNESPLIEDSPAIPGLSAPGLAPPTDLAPLEDVDDRPASSDSNKENKRSNAPAPPTIPYMPGSQRITYIYSRSGQPLLPKNLPTVDGVQTTTIRGGVIILSEAPAPTGIIDLSADSVVIWRRIDQKKGTKSLTPNGETIEDASQPMEVYLEGNVVVRQDTRQIAGSGDQKTFRGQRVYYDFRTGRAVVLEAELDMFAPGLIAPTKLFSPRIDQFRPLERGTDGIFRYGLEHIMADKTTMTGSRFPTPGYRFNSRSLDLTHVVSSKQNPTTGSEVIDPKDPKRQPNLTWNFDARQNVFYLGPVPVFYHPRITGDIDDIEPPLRQIRYGFNNYLGQQILADFNAFRLLGIRRPPPIDSWAVDIDYLSLRTKEFPALGTELGWSGRDLLADLMDPYRTHPKRYSDTIPDGYYGYFDIWGLKDAGVDNLGAGPAIVTANRILPNGVLAGKQGFQRDSVPAFQDFRGRVNLRHMQSLLDSDADPYEDYRFQLEAAYVSDRQFLEEYYKRLTETGLDQETLAYLIRQKNNTAWSIWTEANLQNFNTETAWLPRLDYYRLGDSLFGNRVTYFQHSGADYANTHTAVEVNNPNIFAFMPYDPISNTSGVLQTGRYYTNHEVDVPFNLDNIVRFVPYLQGQAVGWDTQLAGNSVGRVWGAAGARADFMIWRRYSGVDSDLFNVHGLNHKISFQADYRDAVSNVKLNRIGVQDDLDDNTYELVRRYFALDNYVGGVLPMQYDPRHLILRRTVSPITGTTDIQGSIQTLQLNLHSRLQTLRGPKGRRRVTDFMTLDLSTTFFPNANRDNFGQSFGQNMYNYQWFLGDRTSIISYGWFEFFKIGGQPTTLATSNQPGYPFGLNVVTSGISISRPPRGNIYIGYTVLNTGPITTSALNPSISYWLSPKWYGTFSTSYDFGNAILLASMFSFTRVGADYLTTIGLVVDPQRNNYSQFAIAISPRISPGLRFGSGTGLTQFDSRFAPTQ